MTEPERNVRAWPLVGGLVLGVITCWVWITLAIFVVPGTFEGV